MRRKDAEKQIENLEEIASNNTVDDTTDEQLLEEEIMSEYDDNIESEDTFDDDIYDDGYDPYSDIADPDVDEGYPLPVEDYEDDIDDETDPNDDDFEYADFSSENFYDDDNEQDNYEEYNELIISDNNVDYNDILEDDFVDNSDNISSDDDNDKEEPIIDENENNIVNDNDELLDEEEIIPEVEKEDEPEIEPEPSPQPAPRRNLCININAPFVSKQTKSANIDADDKVTEEDEEDFDYEDYSDYVEDITESEDSIYEEDVDEALISEDALIPEEEYDYGFYDNYDDDEYDDISSELENTDSDGLEVQFDDNLEVDTDIESEIDIDYDESFDDINIEDLEDNNISTDIDIEDIQEDEKLLDVELLADTDFDEFINSFEDIDDNDSDIENDTSDDDIAEHDNIIEQDEGIIDDFIETLIDYDDEFDYSDDFTNDLIDYNNNKDDNGDDDLNLQDDNIDEKIDEDLLYAENFDVTNDDIEEEFQLDDNKVEESEPEEVEAFVVPAGYIDYASLNYFQSGMPQFENDIDGNITFNIYDESFYNQVKQTQQENEEENLKENVEEIIEDIAEPEQYEEQYDITEDNVETDDAIEEQEELIDENDDDILPDSEFETDDVIEAMEMLKIFFDNQSELEEENVESNVHDDDVVNEGNDSNEIDNIEPDAENSDNDYEDVFDDVSIDETLDDISDNELYDYIEHMAAEIDSFNEEDIASEVFASDYNDEELIFTSEDLDIMNGINNKNELDVFKEYIEYQEPEVLSNNVDDSEEEFIDYVEPSIKDIISAIKEDHNTTSYDIFDEIDAIPNDEELLYSDMDNFGDSAIFMELQDNANLAESELSYAYYDGETKIPIAIPPLTKKSIHLEDLQIKPNELGICIVNIEDFGNFVTSQSLASANALFDDNYINDTRKWDAKILTELPIKILFASDIPNLKHVIALPTSSFNDDMDIEIVEKLIDAGAHLMLNTSDTIAMSEIPYYKSFDEIVAAVIASEDFTEQARLHRLQKIFHDNKLNAQLVSMAVEQIASKFFIPECFELIRDAANASNGEAREFLFTNSIDITTAMKRNSALKDDNAYNTAYALLKVAAHLLKNDRLSHSLHNEQSHVDRVVKFLQVKQYNKTFRQIAAGTPAKTIIKSLD